MANTFHNFAVKTDPNIPSGLVFDLVIKGPTRVHIGYELKPPHIAIESHPPTK